MNKKIASAVACLAVVLVLAGYMHAVEYHNENDPNRKYRLPMSDHGVVDKDVMHLDFVPLKGNQSIMGLATKIDLLNDQGIRVRFEGGRTLLPWGYFPPFTYEQTYQKGESFATICVKNERGTSLSMFEYYDILNRNGEDWVVLIHADAFTQKYMPCDFPQVITHTRNVFPLGTIMSDGQFEFYMDLFNKRINI